VRGALRADQEPVGAAHRYRPWVLELLRALPLAQPEERLHERGRTAADALDPGQIGQDALVGRGVDVGQVLAAAGPHEEEEVQDLCAELLRQVDHRRDLGHVPVGHRHVQREVELGVAQDPRRPQGGVPRARQVAKRVVLRAIGRVEADRRAEDPVRAHALRLGLAQQHAVGAQHRREILLRRVGGDVPDVLAEQRLAPREDQEDVGIDERDLVHHSPALRRRQLAPRVGPGKRRHIAVRALQIAPLRQIPRHRIRRVRSVRDRRLRRRNRRGRRRQRRRDSRVPC